MFGPININWLFFLELSSISLKLCVCLQLLRAHALQICHTIVLVAESVIRNQTMFNFILLATEPRFMIVLEYLVLFRILLPFKRCHVSLKIGVFVF